MTPREGPPKNYPGEEPNPFVNEWSVFIGTMNAREHTEGCPVPANATPKSEKLRSKPLYSRAHSRLESDAGKRWRMRGAERGRRQKEQEKE